MRKVEFRAKKKKKLKVVREGKRGGVRVREWLEKPQILDSQAK